MSNHIHQEVVFHARPEQIYRALTDAAQFSTMTGPPAEIEPVAGGAFSCFGGMIHGRTLELAADRLLVQAWRVKLWGEGVYSVARFELQPDGADTRVVLDHSGFPDGQAEHLASGWHANYWEPLRKHLARPGD
jgi:activator of HSP90 ATPase